MTAMGPSSVPDVAHLYLETVVSVWRDGRWTPVAEYVSLHGGVLHVITGWNPGAERPTHEENDAANRILYEQLVSRGLVPAHALGADPNSDHAEHSWVVAGLTDEQARKLGAEFGQVAVFRVDGDELTVLACTESWTLSRRLSS